MKLRNTVHVRRATCVLALYLLACGQEDPPSSAEEQCGKIADAYCERWGECGEQFDQFSSVAEAEREVAYCKSAFREDIGCDAVEEVNARFDSCLRGLRTARCELHIDRDEGVAFDVSFPLACKGIFDL